MSPLNDLLLNITNFLKEKDAAGEILWPEEPTASRPCHSPPTSLPVSGTADFDETSSAVPTLLFDHAPSVTPSVYQVSNYAAAACPVDKGPLRLERCAVLAQAPPALSADTEDSSSGSLLEPMNVAQFVSLSPWRATCPCQPTSPLT